MSMLLVEKDRVGLGGICGEKGVLVVYGDEWKKRFSEKQSCIWRRVEEEDKE